MEVVGRIASPLEWHSEFSKELRKENVLFWYLILGVLVHAVALVYLTADSMTCRSAEPGIPEQFAAGIPELRDLNAYVDIICTSDIKARHNYAYFVSIGLIISLFLYGVALKSSLTSIKRAYFLFHRKYLTDFDERVLRNCDINREMLRKRIFRGLWCYLTAKVICSLLLLAATIALIILKYVTEGARDLFLPYENPCGPVLWWDEIRGKDFEIGEYYCHFNNEWTAFMLMILVDVYSLFLIIGLILSLFLSFWRFLFCRACPCDFTGNGIIDLEIPGGEDEDKMPLDKHFDPIGKLATDNRGHYEPAGLREDCRTCCPLPCFHREKNQ